MIIIEKDRRTPKFVWTPHPKDSEFRTTLDRRRYVENEVIKWVDGYNGLTGFQYFYLKEWILKDNVTDRPIHPLWREDDEEIIFKPLEFCEKNMYDYLLFKRREAAWSSILSARMVWRGLTKLGAELPYTSADRDRITAFFEFKLKYGWEKLDLPLRLLDIDTIGKDGLGQMQTKWTNNKTESVLKFHDPLNPSEGSTMIIGKDTEPPNTRAIEGYRAPEVYIDEIGLKSDLSGILGSANSSRNRGLVRAGIILAGGTCADMKPETAKGLRDMVQNSKELKLITQFYLGYHGIFEIPHPTEDGVNIKITHNGYTDHKLAQQTIEQRREALWKLSDKTLYWEFFKAYPLSPDEIFEGNDVSVLPNEIKEKLNKQHFVIVKNEPPKVGRMHMIGGEPVFKEEERGPIVVARPPILGNPYVAGTDPIPFTSKDVKGSEYTTAVKNRVTKGYDAYHAERHNDPNNLIMQSILLQLWYNRSQTLLEMDQGAVAYRMYLDLGYKDLLAYKPNFQGVKYTNISDKPHGYRASVLGAHGLALLTTYANNHAQDIFLPRIYEEYLRFGTSANLDLLDAMRGAELLDEYLIQKEAKDKSRREVVEQQVLSVKNGKKVWVTVRMNKSLMNGEISSDEIHRQ